MSESRLDLAELESDIVPSPVPYAVIVPPEHGVGEPLPLCLMLHGGGGNRDALAAQKPMFDRLWQTGALPPMVIGTASSGEMSFYLDRPDGTALWETFIGERFLAHLRESYAVRSDPAGTVITGASMGGWGSLKIALRHPERFAAVAAMEPAVEPALRHQDTRPRNNFFHTETGNDLMGADRDAAFWEANNPASRAAGNADAIRDSGLAIYLEVGDEDLLNLHDGTEYLHRLLWDLDIVHEYHLVRGGDHVGPSLTRRMAETFIWLGEALARAGSAAAEPKFSDAGRAWMDWASRGFTGEPPTAELDLAGPEAIAVLRAQFAANRKSAAKRDPTMSRRLGKLPPTS